MSASQTGPRGMTAFVPYGESRADTATLLLAAALDAGLDDAASIASSPTFGGFWVSDDLADALGSDPDNVTEEVDPDASTPADPEANPEVDKAVEQLETEVPPVPDAEAAVDAAIEPEATNTSGNKAKKKNSEEESA